MRIRGTAGLIALLLGVAISGARAESVLLSDTSLVSGSQSSVFSFEAPGPGTVTVQLTNVDWPQPLTSLSFLATTTNHVMSSWSDSGASTGANLTFQVAAGGRYFADVFAQAGGALDLGVYSLSIKFAPTVTTVPIPATGALLLTGVLAMLALRRRARLKAPGVEAFASG